MAQQGGPAPWTLREDTGLRRLVWEHVLSQDPPPLRRPWCLISTLLASSLDTEPRGRKQCRTRWDDFLNMVIKKGNWSAQEDHQLLTGVLTYGFAAWTTIARKCVEGRTPSACRSHFKLLSNRGGLARLGDHEALSQAPAAAPRRRTAAPRPPAAPKPGGGPSKGRKPASRKAAAAAAAPPPPPPPTLSAAVQLPPLLPTPTPPSAAAGIAPRQEWGALLLLPSDSELLDLDLLSDSELLDVELPCCPRLQPLCSGGCAGASTAPAAAPASSEDDACSQYHVAPCRDAADGSPATALASSEEEDEWEADMELFCDEVFWAASAAAAAAAAAAVPASANQWDRLMFQS